MQAEVEQNCFLISPDCILAAEQRQHHGQSMGLLMHAQNNGGSITIMTLLVAQAAADGDEERPIATVLNPF